LGRQLLSRLPGALGTSRTSGRDVTMDIVNREQVLSVIDRLSPELIVNTAAMTSVDGCERDPDAARRIHVDGTQHLIEACRVSGSRLVHLSTNYVFDGEAGPYAEGDDPNPLSLYGQTKFESEGLVLEADESALVIRTAVFYGPQYDRPNFVTWALKELILGHAIRVVTDEWANPTYAPDLADSILALVNGNSVGGLYHGAGPDYFSRYDLVMALCGIFDLDRDLVTPIVSADLGQDAPRPARAGLKTDKIQSAIGGVFRPLEENLEKLKEWIGDPESWAGRKA